MGNLVLLHDHLEGQNKIQDHYKSELYVIESKHWDPNVYKIKPLCGKGPMHMVNRRQLFDLQKSPGDNLLHPAPDTHLPIMLMQKSLKVPPVVHWYGTRSRTKVDSASLTTSYEEENRSGVIGNLFNCVTKNYGGKHVRYQYCHNCIACKFFYYFFMVVLITTGTITVGSVVVMAAEAWHPRTDVLG